MDLPEKLTNVRRATRLLAAYYRRVMSVLTLINQANEAIPVVALKFTRWDPAHTDPIGKQTTSPFGRWGWDFLPLSYSTFRWSTEGALTPVRPGSAFVGIWHEVDDGYTSSGADEPDPTTFGAAEAQRTRLYVWILALKSGTTTDTWDAIGKVAENAFNAAEQSDGAVRDVPIGSVGGTMPGTVIRYLGWEVPIEAIGTEQDVEVLILQRLRQAIAAVFA
jgi:hypothetical protein